MTGVIAVGVLQSKSPLLEAERRLGERMERVEALAEKVMKTREKLCSGT